MGILFVMHIKQTEKKKEKMKQTEKMKEKK